MLTSIARELQDGVALARVLAAWRVWDKRKPLISDALKRIHGRQ